jgi:hypothetical protein
VPTQEERAADNAYKDAEAELRSATRRIRSTICKFDRSNQRLALSYEFSPRMKMIDDVTPQYLGEMYVQRHVGVVYMSLASIAEALDGPDLDQHGAIAEGPGRHRFLRGVELGSGLRHAPIPRQCGYRQHHVAPCHSVAGTPDCGRVDSCNGPQDEVTTLHQPTKLPLRVGLGPGPARLVSLQLHR